jgi:hypothetical protein
LPDAPGLLSPEDRTFARQQGLLSAGGSLLRASVSPTPVGVGPALSEAIIAGRGGAYGGIDTRDALAQRAAGQAMMQKRAELAQKYAGKTDLQSLLALFSEQVTMGDTEAALRTSEVVKALAYNQPKVDTTTKDAAYYRATYNLPAAISDAEAVRLGRLHEQAAITHQAGAELTPAELRQRQQNAKTAAKEGAEGVARRLAAQGVDFNTILTTLSGLQRQSGNELLTQEELNGIAQAALDDRQRMDRQGAGGVNAILDRLREPGQGGEAAAPVTPTVVAPPTAPRRATSPEDRWDELVRGGMDRAKATAQVKREFKIP